MVTLKHINESDLQTLWTIGYKKKGLYRQNMTHHTFMNIDNTLMTISLKAKGISFKI